MIEIKKVFVDTAPFIYFIEGNNKFSILARNMFLKYLNDDVEIITSVFTDVEYKVLPKRNSEYAKMQAYDDIKDEFDISTLSINKNTCDIALDIRSNNSAIKLIDAFQLAIAIENHCDALITNDKELLKFNGINSITLDSFETV